MAFRASKVKTHLAQKQVQALIRSFDPITVQIERAVRTFAPLKQQVMHFDIVYRGEALEIPATGAVTTFGMGQVENKQPRLMIAGKRDIRQGDFVTLHDRRYQVEFEPGWFNQSYTLITLNQWEQ